MLSKACVVGAYQRKLEAIAAWEGVDLTVAVPPGWRDERGFTPLERAYTSGYRLVVEPMAFNGNFHLHFYPGLRRLLNQVQPDLVHIDEEPYNLATWHAQWLARQVGAKTLFFSWQNIQRSYPPPFRWLEQAVLHRADAGIAGNQEAVAVWRAKGYRGPLAVIPQFGIDPELFQPAVPRPSSAAYFTIGYAGRLVPEKGVDVLLAALTRLPPSTRLHIRGAGPHQPALQAWAAEHGLAERVRFDPLLPSTQTPAYYTSLDCLVLPSRTRPNWKEQFGRVLTEAMACGIPVVGSTCGEIPHVIGEAGLVFPEGEAEALAAQLHRLIAEPALRVELSRRGRERVLRWFTHEHIAAETVALYRRLIADPAR